MTPDVKKQPLLEHKPNTTMVLHKCVACGKYEDVELLIDDPHDAADQYCIDCAEYVFAPDDVVQYESGVGKVTSTFLHWLRACDKYTEAEIADYEDRCADLMAGIYSSDDRKVAAI
jgi:hypothetical protein